MAVNGTSSPSFAWSALIPVVTALAGGLFGRSSGSSSSSGQMTNSALDPQMMEMLNEQRMRMRYQNPLFEEVNTLMRSLMPRSAKPASYVLPSNINTTPPPIENTDPTPQDPNPQVGYPDNPTARAVRMMASGISPIQQAKLFRR